jgi:hypothetical protein
MATEAQRRANAKYARNNVTQKVLRLYPGDADVLAELERHGRGWGEYVRRLVREDAARRAGEAGVRAE